MGYALTRRLDLPPLMFDRGELEALAVGLRFTQAYGDAALRTAAERAQFKIRGVVPRDLAERMRDTPAFVTRRTEGMAAHLAELLEAVERRAVIELSYADAAGKSSVRSVWPLGALFSAQAWTLVAWCELREDFRSFRLDRIVSVRASARRYPVEQGRTLQDFFHDMHSRYGIATSDFDPDR